MTSLEIQPCAKDFLSLSHDMHPNLLVVLKFFFSILQRPNESRWIDPFWDKIEGWCYCEAVHGHHNFAWPSATCERIALLPCDCTQLERWWNMRCPLATALGRKRKKNIRAKQANRPLGSNPGAVTMSSLGALPECRLKGNLRLGFYGRLLPWVYDKIERWTMAAVKGGLWRWEPVQCHAWRVHDLKW